MAPRTRRHAREWALQLLFQLDANPSHDLTDLFEQFWLQQFALRRDEESDPRRHYPDGPLPLPTPEEAAAKIAPAKLRAFTEHLVRGVVGNLDPIDAKITSYAENWSLPRMAGVDRNVLRLAFFELFFSEEAPPVVVINEAIDLAKFFSTPQSGRFVNGILDRARKEVKRPARSRTDGRTTQRSRQAIVAPSVPSEYTPGRIQP